MLIEALALLRTCGVSFSASIVGDALPDDREYHEQLKRDVAVRGLSDTVTFRPGVAHKDVPEVLREHSVFVNCAPSGMFDKALFEAARTGLLVYATSKDWQELVMPQTAYFDTPEALADLLEGACTGSNDALIDAQDKAVEAHSLSALMERIMEELVRE